jgi:hypothetical protein
MITHKNKNHKAQSLITKCQMMKKKKKSISKNVKKKKNLSKFGLPRLTRNIQYEIGIKKLMFNKIT